MSVVESRSGLAKQNRHAGGQTDMQTHRQSCGHRFRQKQSKASKAKQAKRSKAKQAKQTKQAKRRQAKQSKQRQAKRSKQSKASKARHARQARQARQLDVEFLKEPELITIWVAVDILNLDIVK